MDPAGWLTRVPRSCGLSFSFPIAHGPRLGFLKEVTFLLRVFSPLRNPESLCEETWLSCAPVWKKGHSGDDCPTISTRSKTTSII
ncbi:Uncharacterized protein TCM_006605 [Theobroma cacao]|uniref:Uncharacterized protein n=1 Tax=Theobroma cacao TaxID=3641 RepID=A0A061DY06_THECC|nr:Uncharacterized protein TCM_006605 [Theobroma cacao]